MQKYNNLVRQTTFKSVFACYARQLYIPIYRLIKTNIINNTNKKQKRLDHISPIFIIYRIANYFIRLCLVLPNQDPSSCLQPLG